MPLAPAIAASLAPLTTRPWALYVGNLDVIKEPVTSPRYAVPQDSIKLQTAFWDNVGSLSFSIDDPSLVFDTTSVQPGLEVRFTEYRAGVTYEWFVGYITGVEWVTGFGEQARTINVTCAGIEVLLDWVVTVADLTYPALSHFDDVFQGCIANTTGLPGGLRAFAEDRTVIPDCYQTDADRPIGTAFSTLNATPTTIPAGTSLRQCARYALGTVYPDVHTTIDVYRGVRTKILRAVGAGYAPDTTGDPWPLYTTHYNETPGSITIPNGTTKQASNMRIEYSGLSGVRTVSVTDPGFLTQPLSDGTGLAGPAAVIAYAPPAPTQQSDLFLKALAYLAMNGFASRGELIIEDARAAWGLRPTSFTVSHMVVTIPALSMTAVSLTFTEIDTRFHGDDYDFTIRFGIQTLSGAQKIRSLTRSTN
jgi:hypothetical protein